MKQQLKYFIGNERISLFFNAVENFGPMMKKVKVEMRCKRWY